MSTETKNIKLLKPEDGAAEWGMTLNDNFDIIDSQLNNLDSKATNNLACSGIYNAPTFSVTEDSYSITSMECYFSGIETNGGLITLDNLIISKNEGSPSNAAYERKHIILEATDISNQIIVTTLLVDTIEQNYFTDGKHIYIGDIIFYNSNNTIKIATEISDFTPWTASYTIKDRIENHNQMGTVNNLNLSLEYDNNSFIIKDSKEYYWYLEGIDQGAGNNMVSNFLQKQDDDVQFFRAVSNKIYDNDELKLYTTLSLKYLNNDILTDISSGYFGLFRVGLTKTKNLVIFYTKQQYNNYSDAIIACSHQEELVSSISQKEVGRFVVENTTDNPKIYFYNFYSNQNLTSGINSYQNNIDPEKELYTVGDAAETRSNGIIPIKNDNNYINVTNNILNAKGTGCIAIRNNFYSSSNLFYFDFNVQYDLTQLAQGWNAIYINASGEITIGNGDCLLGYFLKATNATYNMWVCCPDICTTHPDHRDSAQGCRMKLENGVVAYNNGIGYVKTPYLHCEGSNYESGSNNSSFNIKTLSTEQIKFAYGSTTDITSAASTSFQGTTNYSIQKLYLLANEKYIMLKSSNKTSQPTESAILSDTSFGLDLPCAIEIARLLLNGTNVVNLYYTNKNYIGSINMELNTAYGATSSFADTSFETYNGDKTFKTDVANSGASFKIKSSATTQTTYDLANINTNVADIKTLKQTIGSSSDAGSQTGSLWSLVNYLNSQNIITVSTTAPGDALSSYIWIDTQNHQVYIWDGEKYQLMNSWQ